MDISTLLNKYFSGTLSPDESAYFEKLVMEGKHRKKILGLIEAEYQVEKGSAEVPPFDDLLTKIKKEENISRGKLIFLKEKWFWAACAACFIFLVGGAWLGYQMRITKELVSPIAFNTAETNPGQVAKLTLSDGTKVILAGNSSLSFPEQMNTNAVLYLVGEAYFDLVPTSNQIEIKTKEITTITKDSKLNIRAFSKDSTVKVAVAEGSAQIKENATPLSLMKIKEPVKDSAGRKKIKMAELIPAVYIKANEQVTYDKSTKMTDVAKLDGEMVPLFMLYPADYAKKANGENLVIQFKNASLAEITKTLSDKFHLVFEHQLDGRDLPTYTGTFNAKENPLNILMHVCNQLHLGFKVEESIINIYSK